MSQTAGLSAEVSEAIGAEHAARRRAIDLCKDLAARQLEWLPPDGSWHVRWVLEHLMDWEMFFWSQVFARLDEQITRLPRPPMPKSRDQYVSTHYGKDTAGLIADMQAVGDYIDRNAQRLLAGWPIDKAVYEQETIATLTARMTGHYNKHIPKIEAKLAHRDFPQS